MKKLSILCICTHPVILETMVRIINKNEAWSGIGAATEEEATLAFTQNQPDIVLLGSGIEPDAEARLRNAFTTQQPAIIIIQHYGGGSGLMASEIAFALNEIQKRKA